MKSEYLHSFIAVVELGGFHQAAKALHKTQPTITKSVQRLEQQLDIELFRRDTYRATLTEHGKVFYQRAKPIAAQLKELKNVAIELKQGIETKVNIAIDCLYPEEKINELCRSINQQHPHIELNLFTENLGGAIERLLDDDVDLAISENLGNYYVLESKSIFKTNMIPVANKKYFAKNKAALEDVNRLHENRQIILRDSSHLMAKYNFGVVESSNNWCVNQYDKKKQLIFAGFGWGRLPQEEIISDLQSKKLVKLEYPHTETKPLTLSLIRRNDKQHGKICQWLWA